MPAPLTREDLDTTHCVGFEQIIVDNTAGGIGFTQTKYQSGTDRAAAYAVCSVETAPLRSCEDVKTVVSASVGELWNVGDMFVIGQKNFAAVKFVRATDVTALLDVSYFA